jgi:hypothetical protein
MAQSLENAIALQCFGHALLRCDTTQYDTPAALGFAAWESIDTGVSDRTPPHPYRRLPPQTRVADAADDARP